MKVDKSISFKKGNIYGVVIGLIPVIIMSIIYIKIWGLNHFQSGLKLFFLNQQGYFFLTMLTGIIIHEFIHGISWRLIGSQTSKTIQYGIQWKTLTPYAHCQKPIEIKAYCWGIAMPGLILGILPAFVGIGLGNGWLFNFGLIFTIAAGGDILILLLLKNVRSGTLVKDHPTRIGCYIYPETTKNFSK